MSTFLETLKARFADAQTRLQVAQSKLQQAQIEHQAVMQEFASWQNAINVETRREEMQKAATHPPNPVQAQHPTHPSQAIRHSAIVVNPVVHAALPMPAVPIPVQPPIRPQVDHDDEPAVNKTDLIRDVLRKHTNGITPAEIWKQLREHMGRAYVYAVLHRLKERKQVTERKGKYYLQVVEKSEEEKREAIVQ